MIESLEEAETHREENKSAMCSYCEREIHGEPEFCFICRKALCRIIHCSSGYMIPGFVQLQSLCHICRTQWQKYYAMLENIEADVAYKRAAVLEQWRKVEYND